MYQITKNCNFSVEFHKFDFMIYSNNFTSCIGNKLGIKVCFTINETLIFSLDFCLIYLLYFTIDDWAETC